MTISNTNYLDVTLTSKGHGTYQYKLRALKLLPHDESVFVNVYSPATKQTIQLPIQSSRVIPKCTTQPFQNVSSFFVGIISNIGLIISALLVLAATIWGEFSSFDKVKSNCDSILIDPFFSQQRSFTVYRLRGNNKPMVSQFHNILTATYFR